MAILDNIKLKAANFKCFGDTAYGFERFLPINLIIGKNNSGKSTLLDIIEYITNPKDISNLGHKKTLPQIMLSKTLTEEELKKVFKDSHSGGNIPGNHWRFGSKWIGKNIEWSKDWEWYKNSQDGMIKYNFINIEPGLKLDDPGSIHENLANAATDPFADLTFERLLADRDIVVEQDSRDLEIRRNGFGLTNAIQNIISSSDRPSELVETILLEELNKIFEPDGSFARIKYQRLKNDTMELYLEEKGKGNIPLSHTGSGLKTILLVLAFIYIVPYLQDNKSLKSYLFGFEELENNLHPALLRRLLLYLRNVALEKECIFFLTTHSSVTIDLFAKDKSAQILHVTHDSSEAKVQPINTYFESVETLNDLGVKPSDILQANCIVWVEGPTDRYYFNRWIEIFSDGEFKEGTHYQCVFYGGKLLSHLSATSPSDEANEAVKILKVNYNAIIIIDSDKTNEEDGINETKNRIVSEMDKIGAISWITAGTEVENYIPKQALASFYKGKKTYDIPRYGNIKDVLNKIKDGEGDRLNKVEFARDICSHITLKNANVLKLEEKISSVLEQIRQWNS